MSSESAYIMLQNAEQGGKFVAESPDHYKDLKKAIIQLFENNAAAYFHRIKLEGTPT